MITIIVYYAFISRWLEFRFKLSNILQGILSLPFILGKKVLVHISVLLGVDGKVKFGLDEPS